MKSNWFIELLAKLIVALFKDYFDMDLAAYRRGAQDAEQNLRDDQTARATKAEELRNATAALPDDDLDDLMRSPSRRM